MLNLLLFSFGSLLVLLFFLLLFLFLLLCLPFFYPYTSYYHTLIPLSLIFLIAMFIFTVSSLVTTHLRSPTLSSHTGLSFLLVFQRIHHLFLPSASTSLPPPTSDPILLIRTPPCTPIQFLLSSCDCLSLSCSSSSSSRPLSSSHTLGFYHS